MPPTGTEWTNWHIYTHTHTQTYTLEWRMSKLLVRTSTAVLALIVDAQQMSWALDDRTTKLGCFNNSIHCVMIASTIDTLLGPNTLMIWYSSARINWMSRSTDDAVVAVFADDVVTIVAFVVVDDVDVLEALELVWLCWLMSTLDK